jgi:hypothetical protein
MNFDWRMETSWLGWLLCQTFSLWTVSDEGEIAGLLEPGSATSLVTGPMPVRIIYSTTKLLTD